MSEHLLFLQAAGTEYSKAHDLVAAVAEAVRAPHDDQAAGDLGTGGSHSGVNGVNNGFAARHPALDPERIADRLERHGYTRLESLIVALAAHATVAVPLGELDVEWIASTAARIGDADLLLEAAGVVFAFNTINRIADARRVRLEYRFLRELKPIRGWIERRLAWLTGLAYDLTFRHRARHSSAEMLDRLAGLFERLGAPAVPSVFHWLSRSPVVLEGVLEMLDVNITYSSLQSDLLKEAAAIAVASRSMQDSGLKEAVEQWLPRELFSNPQALRAWAAPPDREAEPNLVSACRRYAWQVANAAYTITDEQIGELTALGLSDAELLDLTLVTSVFSALAIIEPIAAAVAPLPVGGGKALPATRLQQVQVQSV